MLVNKTLLAKRFNPCFENQEGPEHMHSIKYKSHRKKVVVLKGENVPTVVTSGSVVVDI